MTKRKQASGLTACCAKALLAIVVAGSAITPLPSIGTQVAFAEGGPTSQDAVFAADLKVKGGTSVTIASSGVSSNQIWFAPAGTTSFVAGVTMTRATNGVATKINAPSRSGTYKLYVLDSARRASLASIATLTVDSDAPTTQNVVFSAARMVKGGATMPINPSGDETNTIWIAPSGTSKFAAAANMTRSVSGNATEMSAPANPGSYRVYVVDEVGNVSPASTAVLTVKNTPPTNQNTVFPASVKKKANGDVPLSSSGVIGNSVWFAPAGTTSFAEGPTMTKAANGTARTIKAPGTDGVYNLYVLDEAGNVSAPSKAVLTVDGQSPTNQDVVFSANVSKKSGASVTIVSSGDTTNQIWFAPAGTTSFAAGPTKTKAASGTATTILAPSTVGQYKLYIVDSAGNVSPESAATLTVDNSVSSVQNTVFASNRTVKGGAPVTIVSSNVATNEIWFAPASAKSFTAGPTMTKAADGLATTINAPTTAGTYKLFVKTAAGDISPASTAALTVDNTPPTNQNTVFSANTAKTSGGAVKIGSAGDAGGFVWFAPAGTTVFAEGPTMTRATGTAVTIAAPAVEGAYKLYVFDTAGNQSAASNATLTVDNTPPSNQNAVFPYNVLQKGGAAVAIYGSGNATDQIWFAPEQAPSAFVAGPTMTKAGSGTASTIAAPSAAGVYRLYVVDAAGNVSPPSTATLTVNNAVPTSQDTVFGASVRVRGGAWVSIAGTGDPSQEMWFAPNGTKTFTDNGTTMTMTSGSATGIDAPTTNGAYKLYIRDSLGRVSAPSAATLTVSNAPPSNQNAVFTASITRQGGADVTINSSGDPSNEVWFAPSGAVSFYESDTMTMADSGLANTIAAPNNEGVYKLFIRDSAGNVSPESTATLTVRNSGPTVQNNVFPQNTWRKGGTSVAIASAGNPAYQIWFASPGTSEFSPDSSTTRAASGTSTSMLAPSDEGEYKLFVVDELGNVSAESNASLFVDNTAPSLSSNEIDGSLLTLVYDEPLLSSSVPAANSFVVAVNGIARSIQSITIVEDAVRIRLLSPVTSEQTVTVGYSRGETKLQDAAGNAADSFSEEEASNMTSEDGSADPGETQTDGEQTGSGNLSVASNGVTISASSTPVSLRNKSYAKAAIDATTLTGAFDAWKGRSGISHKLRIEADDSTGAARIELAGDALAAGRKASADAVVRVTFGAASYELPVRAIDPDALAKSLGVATKNVRIVIQAELLSGDEAQRIADQAAAAGATTVSGSYDFVVYAEATGKTPLEVKTFAGGYMTRTIALDEEVDPARATGAIVDRETGELSFVPTMFESPGGTPMAVMKRPGNSTYVVVTAEKSFADLDGHWAQDDIVMLASKLIVKGISDDEFGPDNKITRAQFTSLLVRSLGMAENRDAANFLDVAQGAWYAGAVGAAVKAGIVSGYDDGRFGPDDNITREQMAVMVASALRAAGKEAAVGDRQDELLEVFLDAPFISSWAQAAVAMSVEAGIINGMTDITFEPAVNATRAQAVVVLRKLLQYAEFMN
ncbi:S-layer homology domain-containing protein [Paenibacillus cymbidii]|uniref:S-layer homology domain-containing protein n=1 Tax=Paenibacillus cymbidii TaxID=1639034 RepID=UPI001436CBFF|nr:S-layer homology domain-containing protein [Paenibacillus cymbidii]